MMKNEKVIFTAPREVSKVEEEVESPGNKEILVRTTKSLISTGTELTILSGKFPEDSFWADYGSYPFTAGYSSVGVVEETGSEVNDYEVGDRVITRSPHAKYSLVEIQDECESQIIDAIKVPEDISDIEASLHAISAIAMNGVRLADISMGEDTIIVGEGIVGQLATVFARYEGAYPLVAVDLSEMRLEKAKESGAKITLNKTAKESEEKIRELTDGKMADVVFEVTGIPDVVAEAIKLTKQRGRFIVLSSPKGRTEIDFHDEVNAPSRVIIGAHETSSPNHGTPYNPWTSRRNTKFFLQLLKEDEINVDHLITDQFSFEEAGEAYKMLLEDRTQALGVVLNYE